MHEEHRKRLRKKFISNCDAMEKHEILELLLSFAIPRRNTNEQAHALLKQFGSVKDVIDAPMDALQSIGGVGERSAVLIKLVGVLTRLYMEDTSPKSRSLTKDQIGRILMNKFINRTDETLAMVLFNAKMRMIYCDILNKGDIHSVSTSAKDLLELALKYKARYAILAHNHPSGIALPSKNDIEATISLRQMFKPLGILLIDHLIFSENDYVSLADSELGDSIFN